MRNRKVSENIGTPYGTTIVSPEDATPWKRLIHLGPGALSPGELIASILYDTGDDAQNIANKILQKAGSIRALAAISHGALMEIDGITTQRAAAIIAGIALGRRTELAGKGEITTIKGPQDVAAYIAGILRDEKREFLYAIFLDTKNNIIRQMPVSIGLLDRSLISPRELFREAIREGAAAVIIAHNHPSGDPTPSQDDINVTNNLISAGKIIGVPILDHIILGDTCFVSLRERGLI